MKHIIRIIPAIALAAVLSGCGDNQSSTSTITVDSTAINAPPTSNTATDQTGNGISGGTATGAATSNGDNSAAPGNAGTTNAGGSAAASTSGSSANGSTTVLSGERTNSNTRGTTHQRIKNPDSMDSRHGLAPPR